jgi:hypothetical protein
MASATYRKHRRERVLRKYANFRKRKSEIHAEYFAGAPIRCDHVTEITIRDTRPLRSTVVFRFEWVDKGAVLGRARAFMNGKKIMQRRVGAQGIGEIVGLVVK